MQFRAGESVKKKEKNYAPPSVNVVINNARSKRDKDRKKEKKSCLDKLKGLSLILKIAVACVTLAPIITPIILSRINRNPDPTDKTTPTSPESLMVLAGYRGSISYLLNSNGMTRNVAIKMPASKTDLNYLYSSVSASIRGRMYIFGGASNSEYKNRVTFQLSSHRKI